MQHSIAFSGKILILGYGAIAQGLLSLFQKYTDINFKNIIIVDKLDKRNTLQEAIIQGAQFIEYPISKENYENFLSKHLKMGDILIDLSTGISTLALLQWSQDHEVHFINTCIDQWCAPQLKPLYDQYMKTVELSKQWKSKATVITTHGANPGLVSHWTKEGLKAIALHLVQRSPDKELKQKLEKALSDNNFAELSYVTGTKVIQIAERDMQRINKPKKVNEFVNTWSVYAMFSESTMPVEFGWGNHEQKLDYAKIINDRYITFPGSRAMNWLMHSWVPQGPIIGMLIPHEEAFSISDYLTIYKDNQINPTHGLKSMALGTPENIPSHSSLASTLQVSRDRIIYRPTSYYVYLANDATFCSLHEVSMQGYQLQPYFRIVSDEIIAGHDQLGILLLGDTYGGWWIGSDLSIEQTRSLLDNHNATILQVASGVFAGFVWLINNPQKGFCFPEDLPSDEILRIAAPFLGNNISQHIDWYPKKDALEKDKWSFEQFVVKKY